MATQPIPEGYHTVTPFLTFEDAAEAIEFYKDAFAHSRTRPPSELGGTTAGVFLYVKDVDAVVHRAVEKGATITMEVADQFWGDRFGSLTDPFGHSWSVATHVEDVPPEEMAERAKAANVANAARGRPVPASSVPSSSGVGG